jgi:glycosyltransferase involved in cell wall biosynthesis
MTLVSVVIPTCNRGERIPYAIQSVLDQTYSDLSERKGAQAARNTGIKSAKGDWIAFLDSDDQFLPDSLDSRLRVVHANGLRVVHSGCYVVNSETLNVEAFGVPHLRGQIYKELLRKPGPMFQGLLVSKDALARIGYLDESILSYQEWDTVIRLARYYEFSFLPKPTFIYDCRHPGSISKNALRTARGYEQVFTKHYRSILWYLGPKTLAFHYERLARFYRAANEKAQAHRCLLMAILLWPFRPRAILRRAQRFFDGIYR